MQEIELDVSKHVAPQQPQLLDPADLIGAAEVCRILGITHRSTLTRRIESGAVPVLAQLDGAGGPYVFDRQQIQALPAMHTQALQVVAP
jgi:hypothetical protein